MTAAILEKECPGNSVTAISFALSLVTVASTTLNGKSNAPKDLHRSFNRSERFLFNDTEGSFMQYPFLNFRHRAMRLHVLYLTAF